VPATDQTKEVDAESYLVAAKIGRSEVIEQGYYMQLCGAN